jgi:hypothetical protein
VILHSIVPHDPARLLLQQLANADDADPDARLLSRKKANHAARDADISIVLIATES